MQQHCTLAVPLLGMPKWNLLIYFFRIFQGVIEKMITKLFRVDQAEKKHILMELDWLVLLSDEQMSKGWPFSRILNDELFWVAIGWGWFAPAS